MKSSEKIAADIATTEARLAKLKSNLKQAQKAEADAERETIFAKLKASNLSLADLDAFIATKTGELP
jgi:hypothetical protein